MIDPASFCGFTLASVNLDRLAADTHEANERCRIEHLRREWPTLVFDRAGRVQKDRGDMLKQYRAATAPVPTELERMEARRIADGLASLAERGLEPIYPRGKT